MNVTDLSDDAFAELIHKAPYSVFQALRASRDRGPVTLSRLAAVHLGMGDTVEAFELSTAALRDRSRIDARAAVRALITRGAAGPSLTLNARHRLDFLDAIALIQNHALEGTDLHVATLINWGAAQMITAEVPAANQTLIRAKTIAERVVGPWPLRQARLRTIDFNLWVLKSRPSDSAEGLADMAEANEAAGVPHLAAMCHLLLAAELSKSDLYTASIFHASRAYALYHAGGLPTQAYLARLAIAKIWLNLGLREQASALFSEKPPPLTGTSGHIARAKRELLQLDYAEWASDFDDAYRAADAAYAELAPLVRSAPGLAVGLPLSEVFIAALMLSQKRGRPDHLDVWVSRIDEVSDSLEKLDGGLPHALINRLLVAWVTGAGETAVRLLDELHAAAAESLLPAAAEVPDHSFLAQLTGKLARYLGTDESPASDVDEYWDHVLHLTGEDDESVRAAYRRANLLPVLNRLLAKGQLEPWGQFEAVELARWGSLAGWIGWGESPADSRSRMRSAFVRAAASRDMAFPASLGGATAVRCGPWPGGLHSSLRASRGVLPTVDLHRLMDSGDWHDEPEILQVFLRRGSVHWARVDPSTGTIKTGTATLDQRALDLLRSCVDWASPEPCQIDRDVAAQLALPTEALGAVAAVRCSTGPFVYDRALARDFAMNLPKRLLSPLGRLLDEKASSLPPLTAFAEAIGQLVPPDSGTHCSRPLTLALSAELARLPFGLARLADGRYLGAVRAVALLPPLNTLAAAPRRSVNSTVEEWDIVVAGDSRGDLGYARGVDSSVSLQAALIQNDTLAASRTAVIYKGHYAASTGFPPSRAGLRAGLRDDTLLTAAHLLAADGASPARVALMCCRGAGLHFADEWGGVASALMVNGAAELIAPTWPIIDSEQASVMDERIGRTLRHRGHLELAFADMFREHLESWLCNDRCALPPHWWSGCFMLKG